jgi:hypothetical protein
MTDLQGLHWFLSIEKYVCGYVEGLFLFENLLISQTLRKGDAAADRQP